MKKPVKKKAKATRTKKKATAAKLPLVETIYQLAKGYNFQTRYGHTKGTVVVEMFPRNANAENITVRATTVADEKTRIEMFRISGGEPVTSLDFISDGAPRTELAALHIIKGEIRRFC